MSLIFLGSETALAPNHNHEGCRHDAMHTAERLCDQRGVRLTPMRRQVLELIWESHRAIKAYDLLDKIKSETTAAKPTTVYRALDFLLEQGLIHKLESLNAFIGCRFSGHRHQQLLLTCSKCQEVEERPAQGVMDAIQQELQEAAFSMHHNSIEIHGLCRHCLHG